MRVMTRGGQATLARTSAGRLRALVGRAGDPCCCDDGEIQAFLAVDCCGLGLTIAVEPVVLESCGLGGVVRLNVGLEPWRGLCYTITNVRPETQPERIYRFTEVTCSEEGCGGAEGNSVCPRCTECCLLTSVRPCGEEEEIPPPSEWPCCVHGSGVEREEIWEWVIEDYTPVITFSGCAGDPADVPPCSTPGQLRVLRDSTLSFRQVLRLVERTGFVKRASEDGGSCYPDKQGCAYALIDDQYFDQFGVGNFDPATCSGSVVQTRRDDVHNETRTDSCFEPAGAHEWAAPHLWSAGFLLGNAGSTIFQSRPEFARQLSNPCGYSAYAEECWYTNQPCPVWSESLCQGVRKIEMVSGSGAETCDGGRQEFLFEAWETVGQGAAWRIPTAGNRRAPHVFYRRATLTRTWRYTVFDRTLCRRDACEGGEAGVGLLGARPGGMARGTSARVAAAGGGGGCGGCRQEVGL